MINELDRIQDAIDYKFTKYQNMSTITGKITSQDVCDLLVLFQKLLTCIKKLNKDCIKN